MAIETKQHKLEIENIISRLSTAGVQVDEKEKQEIEQKFIQLVGYRVQPAEAIRTITLEILKKHGIDTKYWGGSGGKAPVVKINQVKVDNEWLSIKAKIVQIWENRSDKVARTGLIGDETGVIKFTVFTKNKDIIPEDFSEGNSYLFENLVSSVWNAQVNVNANKKTTITPCDEVDARRRTETITGVITAISSGSGLIKRCPECNRALVKAQCGEHGKVDGIYDLRIKAVFSPFGKNELIELIVGTEPTTELTKLSVVAAKEIATESMDAAVIEDRFRKEIVGRYFEVTGSMLSDSSMLVESIKPINICTQEALAEALKEGGN